LEEKKKFGLIFLKARRIVHTNPTWHPITHEIPHRIFKKILWSNTSFTMKKSRQAITSLERSTRNPSMSCIMRFMRAPLY